MRRASSTKMRVVEVISQDLVQVVLPVQAVGPPTKAVVQAVQQAADLPTKAVVVQPAQVAGLTSKADNQGPPIC